ncbi:MAG: GNAT family N-acetyltransferase [Oscillospiraceae bacterium]|nr:GNAT family N-acetyltransferase [Oscillospiraceae bacterium]
MTTAKMDVTIVTYNAKYRGDMLFCYLAAKDAMCAYAPDQWAKPDIKEDLLYIERDYLERGGAFYLAVDGRDRVVGMVGVLAAAEAMAVAAASEPVAVAAATASAYASAADAAPTDMWLKRLFIKPEHKGKGIGGRLLAEAERFAVAGGAKTLHTRFAHWYREAAVFYPAKGFVDAAPLDSYTRHMVKELP